MATLGDVEIDVVDSDKPLYSNTVTQKPVEDGADISDHIKQDPVQITLKCYFSGNEAESKHDRLLEMRNSEETFEYIGNFGTYERMVIKEVMPLKNAKYGNGFECDITLQQIRIVEFKTVITELGKDPVTDNQVQGEDEEVKEKDSGSEDKDGDTVDQTTLKNLLDYLGDMFGGEE